jgi:hypothetical protein
MFDSTKWPEDPCPSFGKPLPFAEWWPADPARRPPWQQLQPLHVHRAKTFTVACGPGLLRAADAPPPKR